MTLMQTFQTVIRDQACWVPAALFLFLGAGCAGSSSENPTSAEREEIERLKAENQELPKLRAENEEVQRLRRENQDIPKLRAQYQELVRLKKENEQLRSQLAKTQAPSNPPNARPAGR